MPNVPSSHMSDIAPSGRFSGLRGKLPCGLGPHFLRQRQLLPQIPVSPIPNIPRLSLLRVIGGLQRPIGQYFFCSLGIGISLALVL